MSYVLVWKGSGLGYQIFNIKREFWSEVDVVKSEFVNEEISVLDSLKVKIFFF